MKELEVADSLILHLYRQSQCEEISGVEHLTEHLASIGVSRSQSDRVVSRLKRAGVFEFFDTDSDGDFGQLASEVIEKLEEGLTTKEILRNSSFYSLEVNQYTVGDNNQGVQIVSRSNQVHQHNGSSRDETIDRLIVGLKEAIQATAELAEQEKSDALADSVTIEAQANKAKPNWEVVKSLLENLKHVETLKPYVVEFLAYIGKAFS